MTTAEMIETSPEPLFDIERPGASLDQINKLVLPVDQTILRGARYGDFTSRLLGHGAEYDGIRDYVPGDRPRDVDWKQTARAPENAEKITTLKVRERYQDITPSLWLATDAMTHQNISNPGYHQKQKLALSAASAMLLIAQKEGMPKALIASNEHQQVQSHRSPNVGRNGLLHMSRQFTYLAETADTSTDRENRSHLSDLLTTTGRLATKNIVVVVSDFLDTLDPGAEGGWKPALQQLSAKENQVIAIEVKSPWDLELPDNVERFHGEGEVMWIGSGKKAKAVQDKYREVASDQQAAIDEALEGAGVAHVKLSTAEPRWFTSMYKQLLEAKNQNR